MKIRREFGWVETVALPHYSVRELVANITCTRDLCRERWSER